MRFPMRLRLIQIYRRVSLSLRFIYARGGIVRRSTNIQRRYIDRRENRHTF